MLLFIAAFVAALCALAFAKRLGGAVSFEVRLLHPLRLNHPNEHAYVLYALYEVNEREFACPCTLGRTFSVPRSVFFAQPTFGPAAACTRSLSFRLVLRQLASVVDVQHTLLGCDGGRQRRGYDAAGT